MALATSNRDGGRTNEAGHLRALVKGFTGDVLTGLVVAQRAAGANMSVDVGIGDAIIRRSDGTYGHPVWNDAVFNQPIAPADVANPRNDIVVMYVDYGEVPTTTVSNNTNGVVKIKVVSGAAAGSPVDPTDAAIQSSVVAGNPYTKLARVRVINGATSIGNSVIDDLRDVASAVLADKEVLPGKLYNPYRFRAHRTGAFNFTSGAFAKIQCNTETYDTNSDYDNATNYRYIAPVDGVYSFVGRCSTSSSTTSNRIIAALYKNGTEGLRGSDNTGPFAGSLVAGDMDLKAGDYVELYAFASAALVGDVTTTATNYFLGHLTTVTL